MLNMGGKKAGAEPPEIGNSYKFISEVKKCSEVRFAYSPKNARSCKFSSVNVNLLKKKF